MRNISSKVSRPSRSRANSTTDVEGDGTVKRG